MQGAAGEYLDLDHAVGKQLLQRGESGAGLRCGDAAHQLYAELLEQFGASLTGLVAIGVGSRQSINGGL